MDDSEPKEEETQPQVVQPKVSPVLSYMVFDYDELVGVQFSRNVQRFNLNIEEARNLALQLRQTANLCEKNRRRNKTRGNGS